MHDHSTSHLKMCISKAARVDSTGLHVWTLQSCQHSCTLDRKQSTTSLATSCSAGQGITNKCCYSLVYTKMCPITSSAEEAFEPTRIKNLQKPAKVTLDSFLHLPSFQRSCRFLLRRHGLARLTPSPVANQFPQPRPGTGFPSGPAIAGPRDNPPKRHGPWPSRCLSTR